MTNDTKAILAALKSIEAAIHTQTGAMYNLMGQYLGCETLGGKANLKYLCQETADNFAKKRKTLEGEIATILTEIEEQSCAASIDSDSTSISTTNS